MLYRLEISKTYEGLLRIGVTSREHLEYTLAIYEDDRAFLFLVKHSRLRPEDESRLERAVVIAFSTMGSVSSCEDLELSDEQLTSLRLGMARKVFVNLFAGTRPEARSSTYPTDDQ